LFGIGEVGGRLSNILDFVFVFEGCRMSCCVVDSLVVRRNASPMTVSLFLLAFPGSMGMPLPLKRKNALEGPEVTGGVEGGRSSGLVSSRSASLSEHNDGVGASVTEDDCQDEPGFINRTGGG